MIGETYRAPGPCSPRCIVLGTTQPGKSSTLGVLLNEEGNEA